MAAMATYVRAGLPEVATALAALTGEPHPLAISFSGAEGASPEKAAELNASNHSSEGRLGYGRPVESSRRLTLGHMVT